MHAASGIRYRVLAPTRRGSAGALPADPVHVDGVDIAPIQKRMLVALHGDQRIALQVLARDEPRRVGPSRVPPMPNPWRCPSV